MDNFDLKKYLVENKVTTNSRMMNEAAEKPTIKILKDLYYFDKLDSLGAKADVDEKYHSGARLVFKKGKSIVDDTAYDDSEYEMITSSKRLKKGVDYEVTSNSKMINENEEVPFSDNNLKKVVVAGITYEVGSDDPNDEGTIIAIEKHPKGYFIMGQSGREGYGYGVDFKGNQVDQEEVMENKVTTNSRMMNEISRTALQDIAGIINTYSPEDPADVADIVGELALEHLEDENIPSGQFNAKMRTSIANILTQYNSGKLKKLAAAKQLVSALKDSSNYGEDEQKQGEQKGIKIGSADGVDISVGEESSLQDTQYYIITIGNISATVSVDVGGEPVTLEQVMSETGLSERKAQVIVNHINSQLED